MKKFLLLKTLCLSAIFCGGFSSLSVAQPSPPVIHQVAPPIVVTIAGLRNAQGKPYLNLWESRTIDVVVRNASAEPVNLTTNGAVFLTVLAVDGQALTPPLRVYQSFLSAQMVHSRHRRMFYPGDVLVSGIILHLYEAGEKRSVEPGEASYNGEWVNFPVVSEKGQIMRLQAEYSGYTSEAHDYQVIGPYR